MPRTACGPPIRAFAAIACLAFAASFAAHARGEFAVDVEVALTPRAAAKLAAAKEGVVVDAAYSGAAAKGAEKRTNEVGLIDLGREKIVLPAAAGTAHLSGTVVRPKQLNLVDGPVSVNVNVYSARRSSKDNLLACDFFDGELARARKAPVALRCALIEENVETLHKP